MSIKCQSSRRLLLHLIVQILPGIELEKVIFTVTDQILPRIDLKEVIFTVSDILFPQNEISNHFGRNSTSGVNASCRRDEDEDNNATESATATAVGHMSVGQCHDVRDRTPCGKPRPLTSLTVKIEGGGRKLGVVC